jgi:AmpD protein
MNVIEKHLPDYCVNGQPLKSIDGLVIHYISAINVDPEKKYDVDTNYQLFKDLNRDSMFRDKFLLDDREKRYYASAHYVIDRDGIVYEFVPVEKEAYHAGKSVMHDRKWCNNFTVGIELIGTDTSGFTDEQYINCGQLCATLMSKYDIPYDNIMGHDQVSPTRKKDPSGEYGGSGKNFDWGRMRQMLENVN